MEFEVIKDKTFDEERALYNLHNAYLTHIKFQGPKDGESVLKECEHIIVTNTLFDLRYPLWHVTNCKVNDSTMTELCRAPIWYSKNIALSGNKILGIKALRECSNISLYQDSIISPEFGWRCKNIYINEVELDSQYAFFESKNIDGKKLEFKGKYSFQYIKNSQFDECNFDTKDAFWHSKNVVVKNSYLKGEYLAWYSENLTLVNCTIEGTQPFCYCKNLKLINCKMINCDLSFERSSVKATINGNVLSIKNVKKGKIIVDSCNEIIKDDKCYKGKIIIKGV